MKIGSREEDIKKRTIEFMDKNKKLFDDLAKI
jgi:hypothetical protein